MSDYMYKRLITLFSVFILTVFSFTPTAPAWADNYTPTLGGDSAYTVTAGTSTNYNFYTYDDNGAKQYWIINFNTGNLAGQHTTFSTSSTGATGSITVLLPNETTPRTLYYKYTIPASGWTTTSTQVITPTTSNVQNKVFTSLSTYSLGSAINNSDNNENLDIISDFYNNTLTLTGSEAKFQGALIRNTNSIHNITAAFIKNTITTENGAIDGGMIENYGNGAINNIDAVVVGNKLSAATNYWHTGTFVYNFDSKGINNIKLIYASNIVDGGSSQSGVISNSANSKNTSIGAIESHFIANTFDVTNGISGACIFNQSIHNGNGQTGTISSITGDFISNFVESDSPIAGGLIANKATVLSKMIIGDTTGDFIGNTVVSNEGIMNGGIISNYSASTGNVTMGNITGNFIGNTVTATYNSGGLIDNYVNNIGTAKIGNIIQLLQTQV